MSLVADLTGVHGTHRHAVRDRHNRLLALALAGSVALHVATIAIGPGIGIGRIDREPAPPLRVTLLRPPVPEPMKPAVRTAPKPEARVLKLKPRPLQKAPPRKPAPIPVPEERPMLALPDAGPSAPSPFSVPQTSPPPPAPEAKPAAPVTAPAPPARDIPSTQPSFSAAYLHNAPPRYPLIARRNGVEGTVRLKVFVNKDGRPGRVQLDHSSGSSALDNAALEAVRTWQFVPARRGQDAIESWVLVPIVFKLESAG